jgi:hypothetical protein
MQEHFARRHWLSQQAKHKYEWYQKELETYRTLVQRAAPHHEKGDQLLTLEKCRREWKSALAELHRHLEKTAEVLQLFQPPPHLHVIMPLFAELLTNRKNA